MDAPAPPTAAAFSGFLPTASLLESLVHTSREIISMEELPSLQTRNVAAAVRRTKLLSSLFEEIRDSSAPLPPLSILGLTELLSVVRRTKSLIDESFTRSMQWRLVQTELVSREFHVCVRELARALDILPLSLIGISGEVGEQVELLHKQAKRAQVFVDPKELRLREELLQVMAINGEDHEKKSMRGVKDILWSIGLRSAEHCQEEMLKLEDEAEAQAGTGGLVAVSIINNLLSLLSYAKSVIYQGDHQPPPMKLRPLVVLPKGLNRSTSWSVTSSASSSVLMNVPDEFRCPISLELMKEPVILASGHTYDRSSIARWINSGHHSCPKTGQKLIHMALIPNYALKSLINQWCKENNVPSTVWERDVLGAKMKVVDHISATREATEAVRMTAEFMVGKLVAGSLEIQRQAAYELRLLAKTSTNNQRIIAEAGAIPFLVNLLRSGDPRTQENAVTALHNLSILENNKSLIMAAGAIDAIIEVLREGVVMEARENAAATMFSLSMVDECKVMIGARPGAITGLVELLRGGTAAGKKDAAKALMNLVVHQTNRGPVVAAGTVAVLVGLLMDEKAGITDEVLVVLALLCACEEGLKEIGENRVLVAILVELMRFGSPAGKENSIALLLGLCRDGGEEMGRRLLMNPRSVPSLQSLAAHGSPKARRKADALLRLLNRCCSHSLSRTPVG